MTKANQSTEQWRLVSVTTDRSAVCRDVLTRLPEWFGRPAALESYVAASTDLPMLACFSEHGVVMGFLSLKHHDDAATEIHVMGVRPAWHRRGIGLALVAAAASQAVARGAGLLTVKTLAPSHPDSHYAATRRFYRTAGFHPVEVFPALWGADTPCLLMAKPLSVSPSRATMADERMIEAGERQLLDANTRASPQAVTALLADDFVEFGSSGWVYDQQATIEALSVEHGDRPVPHREAHDLRVHGLGDNFALVTYRALRRLPEHPPTLSLRSSVWRREGARWVMMFHQGTPVS